MPIQSLTFRKESNRWYIELPAYLAAGGNKDDLEMVLGADTMLELYARKGEIVVLNISESPFPEAEILERTTLTHDLKEGNGADYLMPYFNQQLVNQPVWLCDVTRFVFGKMPEKIFIAQRTN